MMVDRLSSPATAAKISWLITVTVSLPIFLSNTFRTTYGSHSGTCAAFTLSNQPHRTFTPKRSLWKNHDIPEPVKLQSSTTSSSNTNTGTTDEDYEMTEAELLKSIPKQMLVTQCQQHNLSKSGTKEELLMRLREYAAETLRKNQEDTVKNGYDDEEEAEFYYSSVASNSTTYARLVGDDEDENVSPAVSSVAEGVDTARTTIAGTDKTIMSPIPDSNIRINAAGERVVTIYDTKDQNDLSSVNNDSNSLSNIGGGVGSAEDRIKLDPQSMKHVKKSAKEEEKDVEEAKEKVGELVGQLLSGTGLPAFVWGEDEDDEEDDAQDEVAMKEAKYEIYNHEAYNEAVELAKNQSLRQKQRKEIDAKAVEARFDPSNIHPQTLNAYTPYLLHDGGNSLSSVIRDAELNAVGHDGMNGDDQSAGGGHYRIVQQVGAFLEGYRIAEIRRVCRNTVRLLIETLVKEGVEGLDERLAILPAGNFGDLDVTPPSLLSGEPEDDLMLNDDLIYYLEDAVRTQQKKVDGEAKVRQKSDEEKERLEQIYETDTLDIIKGTEELMEDGTIIETIDPNDPTIAKYLKQAQEQAAIAASNAATRTRAKTPSELLLTFLTLLKERVKIEAAFMRGSGGSLADSGDANEKGRNLRLLAYCIKAGETVTSRQEGDAKREALILREMGTSLEKYDSFLDLLSASITYGTSQQAKTPLATTTKPPPLPLPVLKHIRTQTQQLQRRQNLSASGVRDASVPKFNSDMRVDVNAWKTVETRGDLKRDIVDKAALAALDNPDTVSSDDGVSDMDEDDISSPRP